VAVCVDVWVFIPPIQRPLAEVLVGGEGYITRVFVRIKWLDEAREIYPTSMGCTITSESDYHFDNPGVPL
jgi:hypothetical protein